MKGHHPYYRLAAMAVLSFFAMYILMYAMVDRPGDVFNNLNQFYMAGLMAAPMVGIELLVMGGMYPNRGVNLAIAVASVLAMIAFFMLIRQQAAIGDRQFLRSMIPHHSGAILMCERADIARPEIQELCKSIVASQRDEINQMRRLMER